MKIYISGKITGLPKKVAEDNFKAADDTLRLQGYSVVNPMELFAHLEQELTWEEYMLTDIEELFKCDTIYMLTDWKESKGARIEHAIAVETDMKIIYGNDFKLTN